MQEVEATKGIFDAIFPYIKELVVLAVSTAVTGLTVAFRHKLFKPRPAKKDKP